MTKRAPVRPSWRPVLPAAVPFDLAVAWDGASGPPLIPFLPTTPLALVAADTVVRPRSFVAPAFGLTLLASIDPTPHGRLLHLSISHPTALPPWPILIALKRRFFPPDVAAAMLMPEEAVYVNLSRFCLHVWQLPEKWGIG
jgi:hypothetical protein